MDSGAYQALLDALASGDPSDFDLIPLGGARKLTNPQAGLAFDTQGNATTCREPSRGRTSPSSC